jgi:hypothetical protein
MNDRKLALISAVVTEKDDWAIREWESVAAHIASIHASKTTQVGVAIQGAPVMLSDVIRTTMRALGEIEEGEWTSLATLEALSESW